MLVFLALLVSICVSQTSICDQRAIPNDKADQTAYITGIVNAVVTQIVTQLPNPAVRYFNGAFPRFLPISTNYTSPSKSAALNKLVSGLVAFFGGKQALGCSTFSSPTFDLADIHKNVYVNAEAQNYFNDIVIAVLGSNTGRNVPADQLPAVRSVLDSTTPAIVKPTTCSSFASFPGNYLNESDFMFRLVSNFAGLVTQSKTYTLRYFNGKQPAGSTDFTAGGKPLATHLDHVFKYFGGPGFASCLGSDFPDYPGELDNVKIHKNMGITSVAFDQWVGFHIQALKTATGLSDSQVDGYKKILQGFKADIVTSPDSICDKYANALGITTAQLVDAVVQDTIVGLLKDGLTRPYFDGRTPAGSTDFTTDGARATLLVEGLTQFFGGGLGCTDQTIAPYTGREMNVVHANMGVTEEVFDRFNEILLGVMTSKGVEKADTDTVKTVLESFRSAIVPGAINKDAAICVKYSQALGISNFDLVKTVVDGTVQKVVANPKTLPYFNGVTPPESTNFLDAANAAKLTALGEHLIEFFGAALGCTDGTINPYKGADMKSVHQNLQISNSVFTAFNEELLGVMTAAGVTREDTNNVNDLLETLRKDIVAPYTSEDFEPYSLSGGAIAAIIICSIIIAGLFAGICVMLALNEKSLPKLH